MNWGPFVWIWISWMRTVHGFNIDVNFPIVMKKTDENLSNLSYFGFSVLLQKETVYVGAPIYNGTGGLFRCDFNGQIFNTKQSVNCVKTPQESSMDGVLNTWYGATVTNIDEKIYTCAPKYLKGKIFSDLKTSTGSCFSYDPNRKETKLFFQLDYSKVEVKNVKEEKWQTVSIMGMSLITDSNNQELLFGVPWARTNDFNWDLPRIPGHFLRFNSNDKIFEAPSKSKSSWTDVKKSSKNDSHISDLTGTSITTGRFFHGYKSKYQYAVGSPSSDLYHGAVYICEDCFGDGKDSQNQKGNEKIKLKGDQFGSKFGQTVCAVDINGDQFDDLIIGAPTYSHKIGLYDTGKVYVYRTNVNGYKTSLELITSDLNRGNRKLVSGARYGSAIANLGDIHSNSFEAFAIGAPFDGENKEGAIYLYRGSKTFSFTEFEPQVISPTTLHLPQMRGFGYSISGKVDVDENDVPDVVVGALLSEEAVVLRSIKVYYIQSKSKIDLPAKSLNPRLNGFNMTIVTRIEKKIDRDLVVQIDLGSLDDRIQPLEDTNQTVIFPKGSLKKSFTYNFNSTTKNFGLDLSNQTFIPPKIRFNIRLRWSLLEEICPEEIGCPILDFLSRFTEELKPVVELQSGCVDLSNCLCKLNFVESDGFSAIVHQGNKVSLDLLIRNEGSEPAYESGISLSLPYNSNLPKGFDCKNATNFDFNQESQAKTDYLMQCKLPVLLGSANMTFKIPLLFQELPIEASDITFTALIYSGSGCVGNPQFSINSKLDLKYEFDIEAKFDLVSDVSKKQVGYYDAPVVFMHTYVFKNKGPSPTNRDVEFQLHLPKTDLMENVTFNESPGIFCSSEKLSKTKFKTNEPNSKVGYKVYSCSTVACRLHNCKILPGLNVNELVSFNVKMSFVSSKANDDKNVENFVLFSHIQIESKSQHQQVPLIHGQTEFFSMKTGHAQIFRENWPIVLGALIVLIVMIIILVALYKTNSFNKMRFYKNEMEKEEKLARHSRHI